MKMKFLKIGVCMLGACLLIYTVEAQRSSGKRGTTTPATTEGNEQQQNNNSLHHNNSTSLFKTDF